MIPHKYRQTCFQARPSVESNPCQTHLYRQHLNVLKFAQWTTPRRYDPRREDQGKQCWSFVCLVLILFTHACRVSWFVSTDCLGLIQVSCDAHAHTHTESEAFEKTVCDEVYFEFMDLWAIGRCLLIQCILRTSWLVAALVLDAGGCAFVTDSTRVREEIQAMFFLTMFLAFCCNAVNMSPSCPYTIPICDG